MKVLRWKAVVPLAVLLGGLVAVSALALDTLVRRGVEEVGTFLVGARVDVASADVRLTEGSVTLRGLQVTNPDAPMTNLVEAQEIVADLRLGPLLERKVVVETVAVRGVRFGTPRTVSGALDTPNSSRGRIQREISQWASSITVPSFSLEGLSAAVNVRAIDPESLLTLRQARTTVAQADSLRRRWERDLAALNPKPEIDTLRVLIQRLRTANPIQLGIGGTVRLVESARTGINGAAGLRTRLAALDSTTRLGITSVRASLEDAVAARESDYAYAKRLLKLPSLDAPDISPALFAEPAINWLKPVLYWLRVAEEYLPPGLDPRHYPGPARARRAGTTVLYPGRESLPRFLLENGELDLELGGVGAGAGAQAGRYIARISGLTSEPALYGRPLEVFAERSAAVQGPRDIKLTALIDHTRDPVRDSVDLMLAGVALPVVDLPPINARLVLGEGSTELSLGRRGDQIAARWVFRSGNVRWDRVRQGGNGKGEGEGETVVGSRQWAEDFLWRVVSSIRAVEIDVRIQGAITNPSIRVSSNVGDVVALNLRRELGQEVQRAEQQVRREVDRLVRQQLGAARTKVATLQTGIEAEMALRLSEVTRLEADLQAELQKFARGRIRIP